MKHLGRKATGWGLGLVLAIGFSPVAFAEDGTSDARTGPTAPTGQTASPTPAPGSTPSSASPSALPSAPNPAPSVPPIAHPADDGMAYFVSDHGACAGPDADQTVRYDPDTHEMTIQLDVLAAFPTNYTAYHIGLDATAPCVADVTKLSFAGSDPKLTSVTIGESAFAQTSPTAPNQLTSVTFPTGITELTIGKGAFAQSTSNGSNTLHTVALPSTLTSVAIDESAFAQSVIEGPGDNALSGITIPSGVTSLQIGMSAFAQTSVAGDNALTKAEILGGGSYQFIGPSAFEQTADDGQNALTTVTFPSSTKKLEIQGRAFRQSAGTSTALTTINFPSGLTFLSLQDQSFEQVSAGEVTLSTLAFPSHLPELQIGASAFAQTNTGSGDTALRSVTFPQIATTVAIFGNGFAQQAGHNCTLKTINFPQSLSYGLFVTRGAFHQTAGGSTALATVTFPDSSPFLAIDAEVFAQQGEQTTLANVTFPASVETLYVDSQAFAQTGGASALRQILFPFSTPPSGGSWFASDIVGNATHVSWLWFGPDQANLKNWPLLELKSVSVKAQSAVHPASPASNPDQPLVGYRTLSFANVPGQVSTLYVYRDGQSLSSPLSGQTSTIGPIASGGGFNFTLASAHESGKTFLGWCTTPVTGNGSCGGILLTAGMSGHLSANAQLWAAWRTSTPRHNGEGLASTGADGFAPILAIALGLLAVGLATKLRHRKA